MPYPYSKPAVLIASGTSLSALVAVSAGQLVAVEMPAGWDPAGLTFQASVDGINFFNLVDDAGNEVKLVVSANNHVAIGEGTAAKAEHFRGAPYLKIRSGTAAAPIVQSADRLVTLVIRKGAALTRLGL